MGGRADGGWGDGAPDPSYLTPLEPAPILAVFFSSGLNAFLFFKKRTFLDEQFFETPGQKDF